MMLMPQCPQKLNKTYLLYDLGTVGLDGKIYGRLEDLLSQLLTLTCLWKCCIKVSSSFFAQTCLWSILDGNNAMNL